MINIKISGSAGNLRLSVDNREFIEYLKGLGAEVLPGNEYLSPMIGRDSSGPIERDKLSRAALTRLNGPHVYELGRYYTSSPPSLGTLKAICSRESILSVCRAVIEFYQPIDISVIVTAKAEPKPIPVDL